MPQNLGPSHDSTNANQLYSSSRSIFTASQPSSWPAGFPLNANIPGLYPWQVNQPGRMPFLAQTPPTPPFTPARRMPVLNQRLQFFNAIVPNPPPMPTPRVRVPYTPRPLPYSNRRMPENREIRMPKGQVAPNMRGLNKVMILSDFVTFLSVAKGDNHAVPPPG